MPKQTFPLRAGEPARLEVSWDGLWKNFRVSLDGQLVGTVDSPAQLKAGQTLPLPDGSQLSVRLSTGLSGGLQLTRDGQPLPGSSGDPSAQVAIAAGMLFFIAGLNVLLGGLALVAQVKFLLAMGIGAYNIGTGAVYGVLAWLVRDRRSLFALVAGVVLFIADGVLGAATAISAGNSPPVGGLVARVFLIIPMIKGISALRAMRKSDG